MIRGARRTVDQGRPIFIFPQGTRTPPGEKHPYQPGIAALYTGLGIPVVPVALNSGLFWGRRSFVKEPGKLVVECLPVIAPGLDRKTFMTLLEERIETASDRLETEAKATR
jgi:1-acyl-sn-glycerol-3-phosphate acyltransferase